MKVSVIIATKNEEKNIKLLLESIVNQSYKDIEIIVVDNNSSDKTQEIAKEYTSLVFNIGPERSTQRNFGVEKASGALILILDADMKLDNTVVEDCIKVFGSNHNIKAVIIPELSYGTGYWATCKALERNCYLNDTGDIYAPRFFYKNVFKEVGGFDKSMISGEDWDLRNRIVDKGYQIGRISSFIHHNEGSRTLLGILKKKYYYAKNAGPYIDKNVNGLKDIIMYLLRPAIFKNIGMLAKHPLHLPGVFLMVYLEFFIGGFAAIIYKKEFWKKVIKINA